MAISTLVLRGTNLPSPSSYDTEQVLQGGTLTLADGSLSIDIVSPGLIGNYRTIYKIGWTGLTAAEAETVTDEYWETVTAGVATMVTPEGDTVNVQPTKNVKVTRNTFKSGGDLFYNVAFELKRVS